MDEIKEKIENEPDNDFDGWCFDGEIESDWIYRDAIRQIEDIKVKKQCEKLLDKYSDGVISAMKLVDILKDYSRECYDGFFEGDIEILEKQLKETK
jgi:hypothetical protein